MWQELICNDQIRTIVQNINMTRTRFETCSQHLLTPVRSLTDISEQGSSEVITCIYAQYRFDDHMIGCKH